MNKELTFKDIEAFIFDFDGVLTNNKVYIDASGNEIVCCSRADGLAFDVLNKMNKTAFILSTESNPVVKARAEKLKVRAIQGISDKVSALKELSKQESFDLSRTVFVGNDLNDYQMMSICGLTFCPSDSHVEIQKIASIVLSSKGGDGVIRELLEAHFKVNIQSILYEGNSQI
jgi:YrbI family 3-deoxy-D-manno-octulosonate 8-phosphate phosphatase